LPLHGNVVPHSPHEPTVSLSPKRCKSTTNRPLCRFLQPVKKDQNEAMQSFFRRSNSRCLFNTSFPGPKFPKKAKARRSLVLLQAKRYFSFLSLGRSSAWRFHDGRDGKATDASSVAFFSPFVFSFFFFQY